MAESMDTSEVAALPDEDDRKLFVGGLPQVGLLLLLILLLLAQDAKQDDISAHFQSFGEIDNINLKTDPATGRSRFLLVLFAPADPPSLQRVCLRSVQDYRGAEGRGLGGGACSEGQEGELLLQT